MNDTLQRPTDYLTREEIAQLRQISAAKSILMIAHCWGTIFLTWALCAIWTNPLTILLGIMIVGTRQLGLAILNHDAAHYLLFKNKHKNDWVAQWLLSRPLFGATVDGYRKYHLEHHKFTQQPNDPDLPLSAPFPITRSSFYRKVARDLSGQTMWKQRGALLRAFFLRSDESWRQRLIRGGRRFGPNLLINLVFLAVFTAVGHWYLYFLLWVVPDFTWHALITRVRNIGEHGAVPDNNDRLRNTRTVSANRLERLFVAPYYVNYHLEHHLLVSCPCYNLPKLHQLLMSKGFSEQMELKPSYPAMLRHAISKPEAIPA